MQESVSLRIFVRKKGMIRVQSNRRSQQKPLAKKRKRENSPVVRLLPGSHERLASRNHAFCARNMGAHVQRTSSECQWYEKWDEKTDSRAAKKGAKKLVSSDLAKILEYKSSN
jgi:hypothetical protein